jgi:hypothetical protein
MELIPEEIVPASGYVMAGCGLVRSILRSAEVKEPLAPQAVIALIQETFAKKELASIARAVVASMEPIHEVIIPVSGFVMAACGPVLRMARSVTLLAAHPAKLKPKLCVLPCQVRVLRP